MAALAQQAAGASACNCSAPLLVRLTVPVISANLLIIHRHGLEPSSKHARSEPTAGASQRAPPPARSSIVPLSAPSTRATARRAPCAPRNSLGTRPLGSATASTHHCGGQMTTSAQLRLLSDLKASAGQGYRRRGGRLSASLGSKPSSRAHRPLLSRSPINAGHRGGCRSGGAEPRAAAAPLRGCRPRAVLA